MGPSWVGAPFVFFTRIQLQSRCAALTITTIIEPLKNQVLYSAVVFGRRAELAPEQRGPTITKKPKSVILFSKKMLILIEDEKGIFTFTGK